MVTLSASIMAHPIRENTVAEIVEHLDRDVPVIWDDEGPPSRERQRRWRTGRRAWEAADPAADFHIVIQDDVIVCDDMLAGLERALTDGVTRDPPHYLVQPYFGTRRPSKMITADLFRKAEKTGSHWICMSALNWGLAIAAPTESIPDMLRWCDGKYQMTYDMRVGQYYLRVLRWPTFYTNPSLVDHRELPSLVGHGNGRHAYRLHEGSALDIDWSSSGEVIVDGRHKKIQRVRSRREMLATRDPNRYPLDGFAPGATLKRSPGQPLKPKRGTDT